MMTKQLQKQCDYAPEGTWKKRPRFCCVQPGLTWAAIWVRFDDFGGFGGVGKHRKLMI